MAFQQFCLVTVLGDLLGVLWPNLEELLMSKAVIFGNGGMDMLVSMQGKDIPGVLRHKITGRPFQVVSVIGDEATLRPIMGEEIVVKLKDLNSETWEAVR